MQSENSVIPYDKDTLVQVFRGGEGTPIPESYAEQWNDVVDVNEYLYDTPGFSGMIRRNMHRTQIDDRYDGKYLPVYDNEFDLSMIRAMSWLLGDRVPMAKALESRLLDYTIGTGFDWQITSEGNDRLVRMLNKDVARVFDENGWTGDMERESFVREFGDGEFMMSLQLEGPDVRFEIHEGEELTEPVYKRDLEEWIGIEDYVPSWTFGVLTPQNRSDQVKGYHIVRNATGTDWDYFPVEQFVHWKRNVRRSAKRGVTDFYTPHTYLLRGDRVFTNTIEGAAIQAAIAYILEHAEGTTETQARAMSRNTLAGGKTDRVTDRQKSIQRITPGTIRQAPAGQKYHASLLGSNQSTIYIDVLEAALRLAATVYSMPEGMITGTYENNSYASAETSEGPWVVGRRADQSTRARRNQQLIVQILRMLHGLGRYREFGDLEFDELLEVIDVNVTPPDLWPKNRLEQVNALATEVDRGWTSNRTAANELGREYDKEQNMIREDDHVKPDAAQPAMPGETPEDGGNVNQEAIDRVIDRITESEDNKFMPPKQAQANAKKVLEWREKHGDDVAGMTRVGWTRARQLASGKAVSGDIVARMASFARHKQNANVSSDHKDEPWKDAGHVAWLGWGGDAGVEWAAKQDT